MSLRGRSVSGGVAVGRAVILRSDRGGIARVEIPPERVEEERRRLREAAETASRNLSDLARRRTDVVGGEVASILSAHALIAVDPSFLGPVDDLIRRERVNASWALTTVAEQLRAKLAASRDSVLSQRGDDVLNVAEAIRGQLAGGGAGAEIDAVLATGEGIVLVADDLSPQLAARLNPQQLRAIALERGGVNSHAAIIARSFGMPAVVGVAGLLQAAGHRRPVIVDGDRGVVEARPTTEQIRRALKRQQEAQRGKTRRRRTGARTGDGAAVVLRANLELPEELPALERFGAEGIGLFRSEFLYLRQPGRPPGIEEQHEIYATLLRRAAPHPVVIRTYDLGGEKDDGHHALTSPLGLRGIRYCLAHPQMFEEQLAALMLAGAEGDLRVLLPMVSSPEEVRRARGHMEAAARRVGVRRLPPLGVMIEVPSAAVLSEYIAPLCDFFSLGTNDLAQYLLAVDRGDPQVASYYRPFSLAVLRMVELTFRSAVRHGRPVSLCGELAGIPAGAMLLVGMGFRELSMSPVLIPAVAEALGRATLPKLEELARRVMTCVNETKVEEILHAFASRLVA